MVTFEGEALSKLSSPDQLELLNAIDRLRLQGISNYVSLPQIIVCGDQSSGKSSVLEALAGVPFPVKSNLCTRFPTELVLRRSPDTSASVSIKPDESRNEAERLALSRFTENIEDSKALPSIIETAKLVMGISTHGKAFSKDLLRVEISGPNYPHLTIVDLPGLIHSETKHQTASDVKLVQEVVQSYMKEPRSIILAVVSAKNDFANQVVLKLAREADPTGNRTLGVITKPDTLTPGSDSESLFMSLARNQEFEFRLGWHLLKNLDTEKAGENLSDRDALEAQFFSKAPWSDLPLSSKGVDQLRSRLSKVLLKQISSELPGVIDEIEMKYQACQTRLEKLGSPRVTEAEQRLYLLQVSQKLQALVKSAVDGSYDDAFFGDSKTQEGYSRRVRAVIQNLNAEFAEKLLLEGQLRTVYPTGTKSMKPGGITEDQFLDHIEDVMRRTRGRELPGTVNPMIVMELFREQCGPWESLARAHIMRVWGAARSFLALAVVHVADETASNYLLQDFFDPSMKTIFAGLNEQATAILRPHQGHPITYNHYFTETLQNVRRARKHPIDPRSVLSEFFGTDIKKSAYLEGHFDLEHLVELLTPPREPDMGRYAAREAMDCLQAYYKVALKRFMDEVAVQVVEEKLVALLADLLSPISVFSMHLAQVARIAGESEDSRLLREELTKQIEIFEKGLTTCKKFVGLRIAGVTDSPGYHGPLETVSPRVVPTSTSFAATPISYQSVEMGAQPIGGFSSVPTEIVHVSPLGYTPDYTNTAALSAGVGPAKESSSWWGAKATVWKETGRGSDATGRSSVLGLDERIVVAAERASGKMDAKGKGKAIIYDEPEPEVESLPEPEPEPVVFAYPEPEEALAASVGGAPELPGPVVSNGSIWGVPSTSKKDKKKKKVGIARSAVLE